jgi:signal transduction histidine kinase
MDPYLCVVVTDMTERKRAEIAKDEFISLASHQLRTPATSVKQYINMVIDGLFGPLNEEQMQALQKANTSNDRELKIVEDLLRVAQIDAGKVILSMQSANLTKLLADVIAEQSAQCQIRDQKLSFIAAKQPVFARIDSNLMRMVAENLIDNASKYMVEGGTIAISVESKANKAIFRVIDEGVGIAKADTPKLFQKFSRLPNELSVKVGGNGLGLYWVKKVIDLHKAQIDVSSRIGRGTTFTVTLPQGEKFAKDISR